MRDQLLTKKSTRLLPTKPILKKVKKGPAKRRYDVAFASGKDFFVRTFVPKKKTGLRRVTFSTDLSECAAVQRSWSGTWFDDKDYANFKQDSARSLAVLKNEFDNCGTANALDPTKHCIIGLERYLSTGIEETLHRMVKENTLKVLEEQERRRKGFQQVESELSKKEFSVENIGRTW